MKWYVFFALCLCVVGAQGTLRAMEQAQLEAFATRWSNIIQKMEPGKVQEKMTAQAREEQARRAQDLVRALLKNMKFERADALSLGDANQADRDGNTPLLYIIKRSGLQDRELVLKAIVLLIMLGADSNYQNPHDGSTPLSAAKGLLYERDIIMQLRRLGGQSIPTNLGS